MKKINNKLIYRLIRHELHLLIKGMLDLTVRLSVVKQKGKTINQLTPVMTISTSIAGMQFVLTGTGFRSTRNGQQNER